MNGKWPVFGDLTFTGAGPIRGNVQDEGVNERVSDWGIGIFYC